MPDYLTVIVFIAVYFVVAAYFKALPRTGLPPGPKSWPIVGNLNLVYKNIYFHQTLNKLGARYGGYFGLQMGHQPVIVLATQELLHEALIEKSEYFSDRPLHLTLVKLVFRENGLVFQNGQKWERMRRLVVSSMRNFGVGTRDIEEKIQEEVQYMTQEIGKKRGNPFDIKNIVYKTVCNVICSVLFNGRFHYDNKEFIEFLANLNRLFEAGDFQNFAIFLDMPQLTIAAMIQPSILLLPLSAYKARQFVKRRVQEHRETFDPSNIRDFVDMYLEAEHNTETGRHISDSMIFLSIMDLFFAGTDTTSTTLRWLFLFLIKYPEVQEKCRNEIFQVVGSHRHPCHADRSKLPYLGATIKETLRIAMPGPIGGLHSTSESTTLGGYSIPKNTVLITNFYAVHMDPNLWPDPLEFKPERFLDEDGQEKTQIANYMPFGLGKRKCMGDTLAKMELFVVISNLLQRFRFSAVDIHTLPGVNDSLLGITLQPPSYDIIAHDI